MKWPYYQKHKKQVTGKDIFIVGRQTLTTLFYENPLYCIVYSAHPVFLTVSAVFGVFVSLYLWLND